MKVCVIGLGSMGKRRIRLLRQLFPDVEIVGIDSNADRMAAVAREYAIDCCASLDEIRTAMDCAFVCTSPKSHGPIINACLEKGCHVFSEINLLSDLYAENIRMAGQKQRVLFLSSTPLYKEEMRHITEQVRQNGKPCVYQYHVGQYLPDWHPWDDLKEFFVSQKSTNGCRELLAIELPWMQNAFGEVASVRTIRRKTTALPFDFPDTYLVQIEHVGGTVGNLLVDVVSRQAVRRLEVMNEQLYIRWDGTPDSLWEKNISTGELERVGTGAYIHEKEYGEFINEYAYAKEIEEFFAVIKGGQAIYGFEKDKETLRIIDEIERIDEIEGMEETDVMDERR